MIGILELGAPALYGIASERAAIDIATLKPGRRFYEGDTSKLWVVGDGVWIDFTPFMATGGGGAGGTLTDGDKTDITVSGAGSVWTIDPNVVTLAKQAQAPANTVVMNNTGALATLVYATLAQFKAWLSLTLSDITTALGFTPANSSHSHDAADIASGVIAIARLATGTPNGAKFIRDDGSLAVPAAAVADGDKGDIVVSGSGATWTIDPAVLTSAGRALIDDVSVAAQRVTLGISTPNTGSFFV